MSVHGKGATECHKFLHLCFEVRGNMAASYYHSETAALRLTFPGRWGVEDCSSSAFSTSGVPSQSQFIKMAVRLWVLQTLVGRAELQFGKSLLQLLPSHWYFLQRVRTTGNLLTFRPGLGSILITRWVHNKTKMVKNVVCVLSMAGFKYLWT